MQLQPDTIEAGRHLDELIKLNAAGEIPFDKVYEACILYNAMVLRDEIDDQILQDLLREHHENQSIR